MSEYKCCRYCEKGVNIPVDRKTMCKVRGIVEQDFVCPKFSFDPFKMQVKRQRGMDFSVYEKEDYSIE